MAGPELACNHSTALCRLIAAGAVACDRIKISNFERKPDGGEYWREDFAAASPARPVVMHLPLHAGRRPEDEARRRAELHEAVTVSGTPDTNVHLHSRSSEWERPIPADRQTPAEAAAVLERCVAAILAGAADWGLPVLAENVPYRGAADGPLRCLVDPGFISEVVAASGCHLLLDIAHARITAAALGVDVRAYLAALPLARVREIHAIGADLELPTGHPEMAEIDYALLEWALARTMPVRVSVEYGGTGRFEAITEPAAIERQLSRIARMLGK